MEVRSVQPPTVWAGSIEMQRVLFAAEGDSVIAGLREADDAGWWITVDGEDYAAPTGLGDLMEDAFTRFVQSPDDPAKEDDPVNHPSHYTAHPSRVECITITEHMNFCLGNALKYIWRADLKKDAVEDLEKAEWYIDREIKRRRTSP